MSWSGSSRRSATARPPTSMGTAPAEYMRRGWDSYVKVPWEEAYALHAKALVNVAQTYSGEPGQKFLLAQGYDPVMVERAEGAGTRAFNYHRKFQSLWPLLVCGLYRFGN